MLFTEGRSHFFRPLNGKYRAQVVACLAAFYDRLYGAFADYSRSFVRDQVIELFEEALARSPVLDDDDGDDYQPARKSQREQANWVLSLLQEHGWLERNMDGATLQATYAFTRHGRLFTQPMVDAAGGRYRTRHRNTRNTRNALKSFLDKGEVYDLLDAHEYSERIIADFSDVIAELEERRRQLVKEVESQQVVQRASDEFFDFMEKRFLPDVAIRLSADSVEKYRDEISELIGKLKRRPSEFKREAEANLRRAAPELVEDPHLSVLYFILDGIEARMHNASSVMLPALRKALQGFTRRADLIMRQLSYAGRGGHNEIQQLLERYRQATPEQQARALAGMGEATAALTVELPDTDNLKLTTRKPPRTVRSALEAAPEQDYEARRQLFIQTAVDLAFTFNNRAQRDYVVQALGNGHRIHSQNLPVRDARDLLMSAHIIEVGAIQSDEFTFRVTPGGQRLKTDYYDMTDNFTIELLARHLHAE